jgi:ATP-binding protein involved in chromosome partitioning
LKKECFKTFKNYLKEKKMSISPKEILQALSHVEDPDFKKDIVTLGMVRNIEINENDISFDLVLTTPACPLKEVLRNACVNAIKHFISKDAAVNVNVTSEVKNLANLTGSLSKVKNIIAVGSGKGGVGKSLVSLGLANFFASSGAKVGLMDADIYGPSQPKLTGTTNYVPASVSKDNKEFIQPAEIGNLKIFSIGYMVKPDEAIVWRGPMLASAIRQFVNDVEWGELDYLIIDLPPGTGDVQLSLSQTLKLTGAVIVTTPQEIAMDDAVRALQMFKMPAINVPVLGIVENMSWFETKELPGRKFEIFGKGAGEKLSNTFGVPFLGNLPLEYELSKSADNGELLKNTHFVNLFSDIAGNLVRSIAQNMNATATQ